MEFWQRRAVLCTIGRDVMFWHSKRVAIVGHGIPTRDQAPYDDVSTEIWMVNDAYLWLNGRRVTRWFELHDEAHYTSPFLRPPDHWQTLTRQGVPVYMQPPFPPGVAVREYPFERMLKRHGAVFGSSIAWMLALAVEERFNWIGLYGCPMAVGTEYDQQRETVAYWVGYCRGRGIRVWTPVEEEIPQPKLYAIRRATRA